MNMIKKMWWLFAVVAVAMVYWKWNDVKGLMSKNEESAKTPDSEDINEEDN